MRHQEITNVPVPRNVAIVYIPEVLIVAVELVIVKREASVVTQRIIATPLPPVPPFPPFPPTASIVPDHTSIFANTSIFHPFPPDPPPPQPLYPPPALCHPPAPPPPAEGDHP